MKKTGLNKIVAGLLCMVFAISLTGCSGREISLEVADEKTNISFSWWGTDDRHDYTMEAVKQFEELHPEIDVHLQYTEWSGYDKKTAIQMAANTEADVMQINYSWLDKFSSDGAGYYNLDLLKGTLDLGGYDSVQLDYGKSNGILNALPIALNSKICVYNKDVYDEYQLELPQTWDDLLKAAEVMEKDNIYPFDLDRICMLMFSVAYVEQKTGKEFINSDNELNFTEDDVEEMLRFYMNLVDKKVLPYIGEREDANFKNGTVAGTAQWVTSVAGTEKDLKENRNQTAVVAANPMQKGAVRSGWYVKPATMYAISKNTEHPTEAAMFLDFLVNSNEMAVLQGLEKGVPVSKKARDVLQSENALTGIQVEAEEIMRTMNMELMNPYYEDSALQEAFVQATSAIYFDGDSLAHAARDAYEKMLADLKK